MTSSRTLWRLKQWRVFLCFWSITQFFITTLPPQIKVHNVCIPHSKKQNEWNHYTGIIKIQTLPGRANFAPILTKRAITLPIFYVNPTKLYLKTLLVILSFCQNSTFIFPEKGITPEPQARGVIPFEGKINVLILTKISEWRFCHMPKSIF